jgi:hypothetical protein
LELGFAGITNREDMGRSIILPKVTMIELYPAVAFSAAVEFRTELTVVYKAMNLLCPMAKQCLRVSIAHLYELRWRGDWWRRGII